jgi:hypothetical protein
MGIWVGVDWGSGAHAVCVIDAKGMVLDRFEVGHDRAGLAALVMRLRKHDAPGVTPVAIERPSGLLVDGMVADAVARAQTPNIDGLQQEGVSAQGGGAARGGGLAGARREACAQHEQPVEGPQHAAAAARTTSSGRHRTPYASAAGDDVPCHSGRSSGFDLPTLTCRQLTST